MYFQVYSNSKYPQHTGERYRTNGPLVFCWTESDLRIHKNEAVVKTIQETPVAASMIRNLVQVLKTLIICDPKIKSIGFP